MGRDLFFGEVLMKEYLMITLVVTVTWLIGIVLYRQWWKGQQLFRLECETILREFLKEHGHHEFFFLDMKLWLNRKKDVSSHRAIRIICEVIQFPEVNCIGPDKYSYRRFL